MRNITLKQRLSYWFDNLMSRGTAALILWLFISTAILLLMIAALASFTADGRQFAFGRLLWMGLMRTLDPGTMGGDEGSWAFLFLMFAITLGGIFVVGSLIGVLTTGIDEKLSQLRKGRSLVVEQNHTIILGWSPQIFSIVSELVIANLNRSRPCIVILAEKNKADMEDELRDKVADLKNSRLVCRSGSPIEPNDLEIVNPYDARSILILASEGQDPDASTIKSILAITNHPDRRPQPYHIVAEIRAQKNLEVALLVGGDEAQFILADDRRQSRDEMLSRVEKSQLQLPSVWMSSPVHSLVTRQDGFRTFQRTFGHLPTSIIYS